MKYDYATKVALPFGKHKGTTIGELAADKEGQGYLEYLLKWDGLRDFMRTAITTVLDGEQDDPEPTDEDLEKF